MFGTEQESRKPNGVRTLRDSLMSNNAAMPNPYRRRAFCASMELWA